MKSSGQLNPNLVRATLVRILDANRTRFGLPPELLLSILRQRLHGAPGEKELKESLAHLLKCGLVCESHGAWRLTPAGFQYAVRSI